MPLSRTFSILLFLLGAAPVGAGTQERFFTAGDGVTLHYLEAGQGPALVLVPGWTMGADIWDAQIQAFSDRYRVLALDPRCQGGSQKTRKGLTVARRAEDIADLLAHAGAGKAVLVGWSMGGSEALVCAARHPGILAGLVLVDPSPGQPPSRVQRQRRRAFQARLQEDRVGGSLAFTRWMFRRPHPASFYDAITRASLRTPTDAAVSLLEAEGDTGAWRPDYDRVQIPVLCLTSESYHSQGLWLKSRLRGMELETWASDGHALFADDPAAFNEKLRAFLGSIGFPGAPE